MHLANMSWQLLCRVPATAEITPDALWLRHLCVQSLLNRPGALAGYFHLVRPQTLFFFFMQKGSGKC